MNNCRPIVALVAPSSTCLSQMDLARSISQFESLGYQVKPYFRVEDSFERFGGSDEARLLNLHEAARDTTVDVVMALRGGYGISRLLADIDYDLLANSQKVFVGHSDFTALNLALLSVKSKPSLAGPMLLTDFSALELDQFTSTSFRQCLTNTAYSFEFRDDTNVEFMAKGVIWGGNLAVLCSLLGTHFFPHINGGILFLEDVGEHPYRVERMLLQLHMAGVFSRQQAVVLGQFTNYKLSPMDNGFSFARVIEKMRTVVHCPILTGLPFGHVATRLTIPHGVMATLHSEGGVTSVRCDTAFCNIHKG